MEEKKIKIITSKGSERMKKYDEYKDSGVEWIGEVPSHWEICRLKHISSLFGRIGFRGYNQTDLVAEGEGAITLSPSNMQNGKMDFDKCSFLSWNKYYESPEIMIQNGDILFVKTGSTYGKTSFVTSLPMEATINPQIVVFKNVKGNSRYLYYLLTNDIIQKQVALSVGGSTIPTLSQENILNYIIPLAPISEQNTIATYLDKKCGEIDKIISTQQKRIALLQELKQSVITHAVTKGLDLNVEMKDSGVEWIGEVPKHWEVRKLKYIAFLQSGETIKPTEFDEEGKYPVFGGNGFRGYTNKYTNKGLHVLIGRQGALCGNINYADGTFYASEHAIVVYPLNNESIKWLGETMRTCNFNRYSQTAAQPGIAVNVIKNIEFPYPPLSEQQTIATYLDKKCASIDSSISKAHHQVALLQEYKQSLITEVVTGKRKVC